AIRKVTPDGLITTVVGTNLPGYNGDGLGIDTQVFQPNGLYTFPNGTTYILDLGNSMIRKLGLDGEVTTVVEDFAGIVAGRGLWVSPDEQTIVYTSGTDVRRWTAEVGVETIASGFVELGNIAIDPTDGLLVVTDRLGHTVSKIDDDGNITRIAGNATTSGGGDGFSALETGLNEVRGIAFNPDGGYFLATHRDSQIWYVDESDVMHLMIDGDRHDVHSGDGLPISTPGLKVSEIRAVTLAPNGDMIITEHDGGYIRVVDNVNPWVMGDVNLNHELDVDDLEQLIEAAASGDNPQTLDFTFDGLVNSDDVTVWVEEIKRTYLGDANVDGEFNSVDFVQVFQFGQYEDSVAGNSTWRSGDWNGDGDFNSSDLVVAFQSGGYEAGPRAVRAVPEPVSFGWHVLCLVVFYLRKCSGPRSWENSKWGIETTFSGYQNGVG
ncbi:MAG: hypothetical protein KDA92_08595, partial [Planctomycetales bacterium]|nr:hypothetical protein [Planctomycetales bacterium]